MARRTSPAKDIEAIRKKLKHLTMEAKPTQWLDTGDPNLNMVLGSPEKGIPYGKIVELYGPASHGKTMLALHLSKLAQSQGAYVMWVDFENSFDESWARKQGVDPENVYLLRPQAGWFGKSRRVGDPKIQSAEEVFKEAEALINVIRGRDEDAKIFMVVDSVAAILVRGESEAGFTDQNMKTKLSLAAFMTTLLRQWTPVCLNHGVACIFINQIREDPSVMYGSSEYTPGGNALTFYASIRAQVRRVKGGRLKKLGKTVGLRGRINNTKNKAGEGSLEGGECGYVTRFEDGQWAFPSAKEVTSEDFEAWEPEEEDDNE